MDLIEKHSNNLNLTQSFRRDIKERETNLKNGHMYNTHTTHNNLSQTHTSQSSPINNSNQRNNHDIYNVNDNSL